MDEIDVGGKLPRRSEDLFFGIYFCAGPGVAFSSFENAVGRVDGRKKFAELRDALSFLNVAQQFRPTFKIEVPRAAIAGGPWQFQLLVLCT
jgi:hypothetical protein